MQTTVFDYPQLEPFPKKLSDSFYTHSALQIKRLIPVNFCQTALSYFLEHEQFIISKYSTDSTSLVLDQSPDGNKWIKYFEHPLAESFKYFGYFANSSLFSIASHLLGDDVFLRSMEIHTRGSGSSAIPLHQDNGYYGHSTDNSALTFYIALNEQRAEHGGLRYISNKAGTEYSHTFSPAKAFSLMLDPSSVPNTVHPLDFNFMPGDCTVHHPHSIHYADAVPFNSTVSRSVVVRLTFFTLNYQVREGHIQWHKSMLAANRKLSSDE